MFARIASICVLAVAVSGCSSVSDRYAFWRGGNEPTNNTKNPNLGDVPAASDKNDTLAEIAEIRARLEQDRNMANNQIQQNMHYTAATTATTQTTYYVQQNAAAPQVAANMQANTQATNIWDTRIQNAVMDQSYPNMAYAPSNGHQTATPHTWQSGNTVYNYGNQGQTQNYIYGQSPVHIRNLPAYQHIDMAAPNYTSNDPSISINWGALNDTGNTATTVAFSTTDISPLLNNAGQQAVYYAHGSARLSAQDRRQLKRIADQIKTSSAPVLLVGYASQQTGTRNPLAARKVNLDMSTKRSISIANELVRLGVNPSQLRTAAMGDSFAAHGDAANDRRVDILLDR